MVMDAIKKEQKDLPTPTIEMRDAKHETETVVEEGEQK